jgi:hypothetical protein
MVVNTRLEKQAEANYTGPCRSHKGMSVLFRVIGNHYRSFNL